MSDARFVCNEQMEKILVVENSRYLTGALKSIISVIDLLAERYRFEFAMGARSEASDFVAAAGYKIKDFNYLEISRSWRILFYPFVLLANGAKLAKTARLENIEIIHVNDLFNLVGLSAKIFNRKLSVIHHVRLTPDSYLRPIYPVLTWLVRRWADAIVYVSQAAGELFHDAPQATLLYDAMSGEQSLPPKVPSQTLPECSFLYVGHYVRGKGQDFALQAFARILTKVPGATLRFVGKGASGELDPEFVRELKARSLRDGMEGRMFFEGAVESIEKKMKEADVVVNLSESESFSMVCLEALAYGMPLIASDCGGPREIVHNEVNGLLVENRNIEQAADAMLRMATEVGLAARLSAQAPVSVAEKFSAETSAQKLSKVYESLLF